MLFIFIYLLCIAANVVFLYHVYNDTHKPNTLAHNSLHPITLKDKKLINGWLFIIDSFDNYFWIQNCNTIHAGGVNYKCKADWEKLIPGSNYLVVTSTTAPPYSYTITNNGKFNTCNDPTTPFIDPDEYPFVVYMKKDNDIIIDKFHVFNRPNF